MSRWRWERLTTNSVNDGSNDPAKAIDGVGMTVMENAASGFSSIWALAYEHARINRASKAVIEYWIQTLENSNMKAFKSGIYEKSSIYPQLPLAEALVKRTAAFVFSSRRGIMSDM